MWRVLEVRGRHRERFLHSQLTSDVVDLDVGASQLTAALDRSGRLQAFCFLHKREDRIELLVPEAAVEALWAALEARIIADDVRLEVKETPNLRLALGPEAARLQAERAGDEVFPLSVFSSRGFVTWGEAPLPLPAADAVQLEALRVLSGLPRWGLEAGPGVLVNETILVDTAVSHTKGCFLGQETVAKVYSHRGAARGPALLQLADGGEDDLTGQAFAIGERARAGLVRSQISWRGAVYLEAVLHRSWRVDGLAVRLALADGRILEAEVRLPPLLEAPTPAEEAATLHERAVEAFTADRETEALRLLERALAVDPSHADSYESLGVILGRHGQYERAITTMQRLLAVDPDSVMAHSNMSVYYNQLGRIEEAEREAQAAATAAVAARRREHDAATGAERQDGEEGEELRRREEMFREVLELDPDDALGHFGMGELCVQKGRFSEAVRHLEKAIAVDRDYSAAYLALGKAQEGAGQGERAAEVYRKGIEVAAARGDLATANTMQRRLQGLLATAS